MVGCLVTSGSGATDFGNVAETATTNEDSGIGKQDGHGVVVARDGVGSKLGPLVGGRVVQLRDEDAISVGKDHGLALTSCDEDSSVRQDGSIAETAREGHVSNTLDSSRLVGLSEGGDVGVLVGVTVGVVGGTSSGEDLASNSIVHGKDTAHGVNIVSAAGLDNGTLLLSAVPVLIFARASLEDTASLPAEEPGVVILAPDTFMILGEHGLDVGASEHGPLVSLGVVDLTILTLARTRVSSTNCENSSVGENGGSLVATGHLHVGAAGESVGLGVVDTDSVGIGTTLDQDTAIGKLAHTRAEHVVVGIGDLSGANLSTREIKGSELGSARGATESILTPR